MRFHGKTALVTGAAGGIGRETAALLAEGGASLILCDRPGSGIANVAAELATSCGVAAEGIEFDLQDRRALHEGIAQIRSVAPRIDIMAHVAGIFPFAPAAETTDAIWDAVIDVNLSATFVLCREVGSGMLASGGGAIVCVASGAASMANPGLAAYSASKAGMIGLVRVLALEWAPKVRVNVVSPGPTATPNAKGTLGVSNVPMGRKGTAREIADAIAFLASGDAAFITGQTLHANGGKYMP